jgi:hypothetical protein
VTALAAQIRDAAFRSLFAAFSQQPAPGVLSHFGYVAHSPQLRDDIDRAHRGKIPGDLRQVPD